MTVEFTLEQLEFLSEALYDARQLIETDLGEFNIPFDEAKADRLDDLRYYINTAIKNHEMEQQ